jgi:hypothetical protein
MVAFIAVAALIVGVANIGFNQDHANTGKSFFESSSHVVHDSSSID